MRFGIFTIGAWHESRSQAQALNEALEQIELADQLGMDEVWLGEHRFSRHGLLSGIFPFLGAVAARTKRVRIGTAVIVLPLHNPILVAEEAAMLDIISGGRFDFGIGAGYQAQEFEGVGVNMDESRERFRENINVIIKAWTEERLTFHGKYTNVDDLWVLPKPLQQPHPPLFQAVSTSPESIDFAASRQIQVIAGGPTDILGQAPQVIQAWRDRMDFYGHPHAHLDPPMSKAIYVAPTMEEAENDPIGLEDFSSRILRSAGTNGVGHWHAYGQGRQHSQGLRALGQQTTRPGRPRRSGPRRPAASAGYPGGGHRADKANPGSGDQPHLRKLRFSGASPRKGVAFN